MGSAADETRSNTSGASTSLGLRDAWRRLIADGLEQRELIRALYRRNYVHKYAGAGLGYVWVIIMPCLQIFIYNLLQFIGVFTNPNSELPRSITLTFGLILYFGFSETLTRVASGTADSRNYIVQSGIPKMTLVISTIVEVLTDLAIRTVIYLLAMIVTIGIPSSSILLLPVFALPLIGLGLTLGLVLNLFCVIYQDLTNAIRIITFYLLFASGVFTTIPPDGAFFQVLRSSPIYQIISTGRTMALYGDLSVWPDALLATAICLGFLPIAIVAFYRAEKLVNSYL